MPMTRPMEDQKPRRRTSLAPVSSAALSDGVSRQGRDGADIGASRGYANYNEISVATATLTGTTILHYHIGPRLGSGGMGEVYIADDRRLGRQVALKFLPPDRRRDADSRARLFREAQAASLLQSPHIAVTYDLVEHDECDVHRHGVRRGRVDLGARRPRAAAGAGSRGHRRAGGRGARRSARPRHHASRHQERQPDSDRARSREGARLRPREDGDPDVGRSDAADPAGHPGHRAGHGARHDRLHGARTAARRRRRSSRRSLGARRRALRDADGDAAVPRQHAGRCRSIRSSIRIRAPLAQLNSGVPLDVEHIVRRALQKTPVSRYHAARDMHSALRQVARRHRDRRRRTTGVRPRRRWKPASARLPC